MLRLVLMAARDLRIGKLRSVLTACSLLAGILAVVGVFVAGEVTRDVFIAASEQQYARQTTMATTLAGQPLTTRALDALMTASARRLAGRTDSFAVVVTAGAQAAMGTSTQTVSLLLSAGDLRGVRRLPVLRGRWPGDGVPLRMAANRAASELLGGTGTVVRIRATRDQPPVTAVITAVVADGDGQPNLFGSLRAMLSVRPSVAAEQETDVFLHASSGSPDQIQSRLGRIVSDGSGSSAGLQFRRVDQVAGLLSRLRFIRQVFLVCAVIALTISVLGIVNIGLAGVRERARELIIRRAVGATRSDVFRLVLGSSMLVGLLAGGVAVLAALVCIRGYVPHLLDPSLALNPPSFPVAAVIAGLGTGLAAAAVGSVVPATVAARLPIGDALRD